MSKIEEIIARKNIPYVKLADLVGKLQLITNVIPRHRDAVGRFNEYDGFEITASLAPSTNERIRYTAPTALVNLINDLGGADAAISEFYNLSEEGKGIVINDATTTTGTHYYSISVKHF